MHSTRYHSDYVSWRGGYFPPITVTKLKAIPTSVRIVQGGLSVPRSGVSALTHAGLGAGDASVRGMTLDAIKRMCREMWQVDIIPCMRGFSNDSFQGRSVGDITDGNEHVHFLDRDAYDFMHAQAQAQVREILDGGDGLVGNRPFVTHGRSDRSSWEKSPYNPKNIKKPAPKPPEVVKTGAPDRWRKGLFHTTQTSTPRVRPDSQTAASRSAVPPNTNVQVGDWIGAADSHGWVKDALVPNRYWNFDVLSVGAAKRPAWFETGMYHTTAKADAHQYPTSSSRVVVNDVPAGAPVEIDGWAGYADTHTWARDAMGRYWNLEILRLLVPPTSTEPVTLVLKPGTYGGAVLDAEQLDNAVTIDEVGRAMAVPEFGRVVAEATALQESSLRNIDYGDEAGPDSRGLFQQRNGWGTVEERMDPDLAAGKFYEALLRVKGWESMTVAQAAQKVQISADGSLYAKREAPARAIVSTISQLLK